jgi:CDP-glycerol glycerophosphotransferase (TagB/SpsB family)
MPDYIRCRDPRAPPSVQESFAEAALMVTDYSSVAFECAYIDRPTTYYQFDRDEFFAIDHVHAKGYFDYHDNGFGPVAETQDQVLDAIKNALEGNEDSAYAQRREQFFAFRDGKCCERVYNAILEVLPKRIPSE